MGKLLGSYADDNELDRADLNKFPIVIAFLRVRRVLFAERFRKII